MDVNGTRFHLFKGQADWRQLSEADQPTGWLHAAWDDASAAVTLSPLLSLFPRGRRDVPLDPAARRGAAVDRYGNWYWISHDRQRLFWQPSGSGRASLYWEQTAVSCPAPTGDFAPVTPPAPQTAELAGLAVTAHHYLVVGDVTHGGLFVFDLHAGGAPLHFLFPAAVPFTPFDIAAAPGGGVWILDRAQRAYWGLDRYFTVVSEPAFMQQLTPDTTADFWPVGGTAVITPGRDFPTGFPLAAHDPIAIESMPDGSVLILDNPALPGDPSTLRHYHLSSPVSPPLPLEDDVEVATIDQGLTRRYLAVAGHDIAYAPDSHTLYVVERDGNQVIAFHLALAASPPGLSIRRDYLPLHFFGGRALVHRPPAAGEAAAEADVYYDVAGTDASRDGVVRWVRLHAIDQPRYAREAALLTPVLDGKARGCVWHRLFVDGCIPPETAVRVYTRAHDDPDLLDSVPFDPEPALYLRGAGTEISLYEPFPAAETWPPGSGTWELLFQRAVGRYLQIRLELAGSGHVTPQLRALRAYYPRFSYPQKYLPAVYYEDEGPGAFIERLLANMEGFYTDIEGQIAAAAAFFDGRTMPADGLDWLAGWLGLVLDPLWAQIQARRAPVSPGQPAPDRRRLFIRYARLLYERRGTPDGIRFALHLLLDPCLEALLQRLKQAAIAQAPPLTAELARFGLPAPSPASGDAALEDLLFALVLKRPSTIRLVERFQTRSGRALVAGDPTQTGATLTGSAAIQAAAHRFSVLIPEGLLPEEEAMVRRIVNLEKPAHTEFEVRRYWDGFRVGEARLGIDTTLDVSHLYRPTILNRDYLAESYLARAHPQNVRDRLVTDRDRHGALPAL
ncbi:MAG: hypothetical protein KC425_03115 [Anaerolineales bacterium]|nr:hypothetical protein [Anaerolineales bacterium]